MTVQNKIVKSVYVGPKTDKKYPITFDTDHNHPEYIKVYITTASGKPTLTTNYTLEKNSDGKYTDVVYPKTGSALGANDKITIYRELDIEQVLSLVNGGPFFAENVERELDDIVFMMQQLGETVDRTLKVSLDNKITGEATDYDLTFPIPEKTDNNTYGLVINKDGLKLGEDPDKVYRDTVEVKNAAITQVGAIKDQAETARDKAQAWAEENAGTTPSKIGGAKSAKQWAESAQNFANDALSCYNNTNTIKGEVIEIAGTNYHNVYNTLINIDDRVSASLDNANKAERQADIATTKASEANVSATNAASSASSATRSSNSAIQALRDATLINNSGNADTLSAANATNIIQLTSQFDSITKVKKYVNILDNTALHNGYYINMTDGELLPASGNTATDYIEFPINKHIYFYGGNPNQLIRWATYMSDKSFAASYFFYLNSNGEYDFNYDATYISHSYLRFSFSEPIKCNYGQEKIPESWELATNVIPKMRYNYIVAKDGSGDFTTVTEACNTAQNGESIFIKHGVYDNEIIVGTWSKKLYLIGESKEDTIIKNHTGDYNYPPIQIGAGYLENLTFYSQYTGTQERGTGATMAYAVHSESNTLYNENLTIRNCNLISDYAPAFGIGMRGGCNVLLDNCILIGTYSGSLLFHDSENESFAGTQNITVKNCIIKNTNNGLAINMQSQERTGTTVNLEMINNNIVSNKYVKYGVFNYRYGTPNDNDFLGCINFRLSENSFGNTIDVFNNKYFYIDKTVRQGLYHSDTAIVYNSYGWYIVGKINKGGKKIAICKNDNNSFFVGTTKTRPTNGVTFTHTANSSNGVAIIDTDADDKFIYIFIKAGATMSESEKKSYTDGLKVLDSPTVNLIN